MLLISMPNSAITVSQIPPKHFQKAGDGVKKIFCGHSSKIKLNFVLNCSAYIRNISSNLQTVSLYWEANIFTSDNGVWVLFCFLKIMFVLGLQKSYFQLSVYAFEF